MIEHRRDKDSHRSRKQEEPELEPTKDKAKAVTSSSKHGAPAPLESSGSSKSKRLNTINTKSTPSLPHVTTQTPDDKDIINFSDVRSKLKQKPAASKPTEKVKVEDFQEVREKLAHHGPPPQQASSSHDQNEYSVNEAKLAKEPLRKTESDRALSDKTGPNSTDGDSSKPSTASRSSDSSSARDASKDKGKGVDHKGKGKEIDRRHAGPSRRPPTTAANATSGHDEFRPVADSGADHESGWKERYIKLKSDVEGRDEGKDDIGLEGLTIVLHLRGKDDLVINTDLRDVEQREIELS